MALPAAAGRYMSTALITEIVGRFTLELLMLGRFTLEFILPLKAYEKSLRGTAN